MLLVFELDIPSLTQQAIQMRYYSFEEVKELISSSMINCLILIEMLILLIDAFDEEVTN